jgi:hypothetical protein
LTHPTRNHSHGGFVLYPYYDDYESTDELAPQKEGSVNVVVAPQPERTPARAPEAPTESLILEYRDGQWVRISTSIHLPLVPAPVEPRILDSRREGPGPQETSQPPVKLPPAVLVFRDGRQEEVARYVVERDVLYVSTDCWSTGTWTKKTPIADLNIAETSKLSAARGEKFSLPTRPNEIVVRF